MNYLAVKQMVVSTPNFYKNSSSPTLNFSHNDFCNISCLLASAIIQDIEYPVPSRAWVVDFPSFQYTHTPLFVIIISYMFNLHSHCVVHWIFFEKKKAFPYKSIKRIVILMLNKLSYLRKSLF